ncbi:spore germination protein [Xylanibacillus composti]|nr:spore germination protein [Xylanibacillus composti]
MHTIMGGSSDFVIREVTVDGTCDMALFYLDGMVNQRTVQESVISPLLDRLPNQIVTLERIRASVLDASEVKVVDNREDAVEQILSGSLLLLMQGHPEGLIISLPGWEERSIEESKTQPVVKGPADSFIETLRTNTTLVRRRVKDSRLRVCSMTIGSQSKTDIAIMYIEGLAKDELVRDLQQRFESAKLNRVLEGEYLEEILNAKKQRTLFPLNYNTDRPDTIAAGIMEGRVAIFIDGTPFVLLVPSVFVDFIQSAEDYYQPYLFSSLIRLLRFAAFMICMLAPSVYIALTTYHQDMIPTQLLLSLTAQREGVPFPAFVEALLMETTFEILREAGLRMPRTIGQAVSIVGTIVVGQAAVEASIVSAVMVIVVSITAISSFAIPSYAMSIPCRLLRYVFMGLAATMGVYGITIGILVLIVHLCSLESYGVPYMSPLSPYRKKGKQDGILRYPFHRSSENRSGAK